MREVTEEFEKVQIFFHDDGLVPALEQAAALLVAPEEEVGIIGEKRLGVDGQAGAFEERCPSGDELFPIGVVSKDRAPLIFPAHQMVVDGMDVHTGLEGHWGVLHVRTILHRHPPASRILALCLPVRRTATPF